MIEISIQIHDLDDFQELHRILSKFEMIGRAD